MPEIISAKRLRGITEEAQSYTTPVDETAEAWVAWFEMNAKRYLKTAALLGHTEATLDLPIQLARTVNRALYAKILRDLRPLVPGCSLSFVEEEYEGAVLYRLEISWGFKEKLDIPSLRISDLSGT